MTVKEKPGESAAAEYFPYEGPGDAVHITDVSHPKAPNRTHSPSSPSALGSYSPIHGEGSLTAALPSGAVTHALESPVFIPEAASLLRDWVCCEATLLWHLRLLTHGSGPVTSQVRAVEQLCLQRDGAEIRKPQRLW